MTILDDKNELAAGEVNSQMGQGRFEIEAGTLRPGHAVVRVKGEVDLAVANQFEAAITEAGGASELVVVDLSACDFIDSTAIAVMVRAHGELAAAGRRLVVCGPRDQARRVLEITGLTANGLVVDDVNEALD